MYEYEFVRIELGGVFVSKPKQDYHEIIRTYAKKGWTFKQIFAPATAGYGSAAYFELIFERKVS